MPSLEVVIEARASAVQLGISPYDTGAWMTFAINGNGLAEDEGKGTEKRKRGVESDLGGDTSTCATVVEDEVKAAPVGASLEATEQAWADYQSFWDDLSRYNGHNWGEAGHSKNGCVWLVHP